MRLTQDTFAKKLGITRPYLSELENSERSLSPKILGRVTELLRGNEQFSEDEFRTPRFVPVRSWAQAGMGVDFEELPLDWQKRVATDCPDEKAFAVEIQGDSMEPKYTQGDIAVLMPSHAPRTGNLVVARLEGESVVFKIFGARNGGTNKIVVFTSYNQVFQPIEVPEGSVRWVYPVYQVVRQVWR